jgi:hypothetical protein
LRICIHATWTNALNAPLTTRELPPESLPQAWPLVREIVDGATLENWCAFGRAVLSPDTAAFTRRGIVVVERGRTIRGLVTYRTTQAPARGRTLLLSNAVVLDLVLGERIAQLLHSAVLDVARRENCRALVLETVPRMAWIGKIWAAASCDANGLPVSLSHTDCVDLANPFGAVTD